MLLREAKEILKKNGYKVVEAYDAVADRNNIKDRKQKVYSYYSKLTKRLKLALAEEGIESSLYDSNCALKIGNYTVYCFLTDCKVDTVGVYDNTNFTGSESGEQAYLREMENGVTLEIYDSTDKIAKKEFDVRDTPSMVKWIINHIEG